MTRTKLLALPLALTLCALFAASAGAAVPSAKTLTVDKVGGGYVSGTGIDCGTDCSESFDPECEYSPTDGVICTPALTSVTAVNDNGFVFDHWTGCTSTSGATCNVTMSADKSVAAYFNDVHAPSATFESPITAAGTTYNFSGTWNLRVGAVDNAAVARVEFYFRGVKIGQDTTAPYEMTFQSSSYSDGPGTLEASAIDTSNNISSNPKISLNIDNTPPSLQVTGGPNGETYGDQAWLVWPWTASDAGSGILADSIECNIDDTGFMRDCTWATDQGVSVWDPEEGPHTIVIRISDKAGNRTTVTRTWNIDTTAPTTTIASGPAHGAIVEGDSVTYGLSASEAATFKCRLYPLGSTAPAFADCPATKTFTGLAQGNYVFDVKALDGVGNEGPVVSRQVTVVAPKQDTTPPTTDGGGSPQQPSAPAVPEQPSTPAAPEIPATEAARDTTAPLLTLPKQIKVKRSVLLKRGLTWSMLCSEGCRLDAQLLAGKRSVGKLAKALTGGSKAALRMKVSKRLRGRTLTLMVRALDAAGNARTARVKVSVR